MVSSRISHFSYHWGHSPMQRSLLDIYFLYTSDYFVYMYVFMYVYVYMYIHVVVWVCMRMYCTCLCICAKGYWSCLSQLSLITHLSAHPAQHLWQPFPVEMDLAGRRYRKWPWGSVSCSSEILALSTLNHATSQTTSPLPPSLPPSPLSTAWAWSRVLKVNCVTISFYDLLLVFNTEGGNCLFAFWRL